ncbi:MAG: potassium transporter TrkG, partial [Myxococcota bacterium]|nr:potassium transporter TrkG [Myxococcota bacterium]
MNLRLIARLLSRLFAVLAVAMAAASPWEWSTAGSGDASEALALSAGIALFTAIALALVGRGADQVVRLRDALVVVAVGWVAACVLGALPYTLSGAIDSFVDALFESTSGFTTTGATILTDVEGLPRALHFWRVTTHWLGGLGIVVLFVALFPQLGVGAKHLFKSEVPGPITEGLRPKIKQTAVALWWIYVGLTALETLLLWWAGLSPFDAIAHSMSNLATGGFSTRGASVGAYQNPTVEWIVCAFMYLAGVNFALHYA